MVLVAVLGVGGKALQLTSCTSLNACQPPGVAIGAIAAVLVLLAVHAIAVRHALAVHAVAACNGRDCLEIADVPAIKIRIHPHFCGLDSTTHSLNQVTMQPGQTPACLPACMHNKQLPPTMVLVAVSQTLELASGASLNACQPPGVAIGAIATVLVLLAVHAVAVASALAVYAVAACSNAGWLAISSEMIR